MQMDTWNANSKHSGEKRYNNENHEKLIEISAHSYLMVEINPKAFKKA